MKVIELEDYEIRLVNKALLFLAYNLEFEQVCEIQEIPFEKAIKDNVFEEVERRIHNLHDKLIGLE